MTAHRLASCVVVPALATGRWHTAESAYSKTNDTASETTTVTSSSQRQNAKSLMNQRGLGRAQQWYIACCGKILCPDKILQSTERHVSKEAIFAPAFWSSKAEGAGVRPNTDRRQEPQQGRSNQAA